MASFPNPSYSSAFGGFQSQYGGWDDELSMQRSDSHATSCTVDSNYTTASSFSGYSSATEYSAAEFSFATDGAYKEASAYPGPDPPYEHHDANHMLSATGSQYQQSGHHLPQALHLPGPSQQFATQRGREEAAWQATRVANSFLLVHDPYGKGGPSLITSEAVEEALQRHQHADEPARPAVQDVVYEQLCPRISDADRHYSDIVRILEEGAYQLLIRLQGPNVTDICYYAIAAVLAELTGDVEDESKGVTNSEPVDSQGSNSLPAPTAAEKEKFRCDFPGCEKGASRQADLERHYRIVHLKDEEKKKHFCDYKKCSRHTHPFFRQDHFRDHLRITHMEDLLRRGNRGDRKWWASRSPHPMSNGWWRCSRCLVRVGLGESGFVCHNCGSQCEKERQQHRMEAVADATPIGGQHSKGRSSRHLLASGSSSRKRTYSS